MPRCACPKGSAPRRPLTRRTSSPTGRVALSFTPRPNLWVLAHRIGGKGGTMQELFEWRDPDSNRGHHDFQSCALPAELSRPGGAMLATSGSGAGVPRKRRRSSASASSAAPSRASRGANGAIATLPPAIDQVARATPPTRAKGRKTPPLITCGSWGPSTKARERQPTRRGSKAPSSRGGGRGAEGARPARSMRPSGRSVSSCERSRPGRRARRGAAGRPIERGRDRSRARVRVDTGGRAPSGRARGGSAVAGRASRRRGRRRAHRQ